MSQVSQLVQNVGVPLWQHKREFIAFCEWVKLQQFKSVLEIGTGYGGSAYVFGEVTGHGRVVSVDFDQQGAARIDPRKRRRQPNPNFVQITGDSRTDAVEAQIAAYAPFDLVYFDTEHAYECAVDNYRRYVKYASKAVAQHDINMDVEAWAARDQAQDWGGIVRAWAEFCQGKFGEEFIDPENDARFPRWGGIGVVFVR